jgi:proteasome accessory factor C
MSKTSPIQTAARLLDLVPYIYSHQGISIVELAREFGISESELLANLNSLWMCGESRFDLVELDFESGYVHIRNAEALNLVRSLSTQETIAILFGLDLLKNQISGERPDLLQQISELQEKLGSSVQHLVTASQPVDGDILRLIDLAMKKRRKLKISYHSISDDVKSVRIIHPIDRTNSNGELFLRAYCESADAIRTFRIDRILSMGEVEEAAQSKSAHNAQTPKIDVTIRIHGNLRQSLEVLGPARHHGGNEYSISIFNPSWLIREVISAAGSMEITEPPEIRREIARQIETISNQYR